MSLENVSIALQKLTFLSVTLSNSKPLHVLITSDKLSIVYDHDLKKGDTIHSPLTT